MRWWIGAALVLAVAVVCAPACGQCGWTWTSGPAIPTGRAGAAMAYDSARGKAVLVGGRRVDDMISNQTLEFDGSAWQAMTPAGSLPRRVGHAMAYDASRGVIVLFGGLTPAPESLSSSTYEYDGTTWRTVTTPTTPQPRRWHAMAYDSDRHVVVMHGGEVSTGVASDTWEYNGTTWTVRTGSSPGPRAQHAMAYDPVQHRVILFGGVSSTANPVYSTTTWAWNGSVWSDVAGTNPPPRSFGTMAYSPAAQRIVLTGGINGSDYITTTWELGPQGWSAATTSGFVAPRTEGCFTFHEASGRFVQVAGRGSGGLLTDAALLTGGGGVSFVSGPNSRQVTLGQPASFTASVSGTPTSWQWRRGGSTLTNDARISGANSPTLTIQGVTPADAGLYDVVVTSACGGLASNGAMLTVVAPCGDSDYNGDGDFGTDQDIEAFFACLGGNCCPTCYTGGSDFNGDGDYGTDQDIESFFRVLGGGPC